MKYKPKARDEIHDIWLLYRKTWWIFYSFVGCGSREKMIKFVSEKGGEIINL